MKETTETQSQQSQPPSINDIKAAIYDCTVEIRRQQSMIAQLEQALAHLTAQRDSPIKQDVEAINAARAVKEAL